MAVGYFGVTIMIKKITALALVSVFFVATVHAEETVKDTLGIVGKWKVWAESASKDKEKKMVDNLWEFQPNFVLHAISHDPRTGTMDFKSKYNIENGKLMKEKIGRPGKFEACSVEKTADGIILGCPGLYFFMTKIN
jgi:hypothetical protein